MYGLVDKLRERFISDKLISHDEQCIFNNAQKKMVSIEMSEPVDLASTIPFIQPITKS